MSRDGLVDIDRSLAELDARVARVIGWVGVQVARDGSWVGWIRQNGYRPLDLVTAAPPYSTDPSLARAVVSHLWASRRLYLALIGGGDCWRAQFREAPDSAHWAGWSEGATPAEAVCRAALAIVENG